MTGSHLYWFKMYIASSYLYLLIRLLINFLGVIITNIFTYTKVARIMVGGN